MYVRVHQSSVVDLPLLDSCMVKDRVQIPHPPVCYRVSTERFVFKSSARFDFKSDSPPRTKPEAEPWEE